MSQIAFLSCVYTGKCSAALPDEGWRCNGCSPAPELGEGIARKEVPWDGNLSKMWDICWEMLKFMTALTLVAIERLLPDEKCKAHASLITLKYIFKESLWILPWEPCWFVRQSLYLKLYWQWAWEHGWLTALQTEGRMNCCLSARLGITNILFPPSCIFLPLFFSQHDICYLVSLL